MKRKQGRGFIWTREEEQLLVDIYNKNTFPGLVSKFGRSKNAINIKASKLGLKRDLTIRTYHRIWTEKEEAYLKENYAFGKLEKIAVHLGRTKKAISERAKRLKLKRDEETTRILSMKYKVNEQFFSKWSDNMAYVLGLFCADGNMTKKGNGVSIHLHRDDAYLLTDVLKTMKSTHSVRLETDTKMSSICITNKHLYNDLLKLGMIPNKSKTLKCPDVPEEFVPHFIRGVMDGDGSVGAKAKRMKIVSASKDFIYGISDMMRNLEIEHKMYNYPYICNDVKTDFYCIRVLRRKDIKCLYGLMYKNQLLYMKRKKESFKKMGIEDKYFDVKCKSRMRPVIGKNINTGKEIRFMSIKEACENGFCKPHLYSALRGTTSKHKNYTWRYA